LDLLYEQENESGYYKKEKHTTNGLRLHRVLTTARELLKCPTFKFRSITRLRKPTVLPSSGKEGTWL